jgi:hypothetical protein
LQAQGSRIGAAGLAARLAAWSPGTPRPAVVALDGPSGAGKTTLADLVVTALRDLGQVAVAVHLDDLYPGWDGLEAVVPLLVRHVLAPLSGPGPLVVPTWDWRHDVPGPSRTLTALGPPRPDVVLVEGAGGGARACVPYLAGLQWVEAPEDLRRARALARDGDVYGPHWGRWAAQEDRHFAAERTRDRADLVLEAGEGAGNLLVVRDAGR